MKPKVTLLLLLVLTAIGVKGQNLIAVQHAGTPKFFTKLPAAISAAAVGDTVYIPGGTFDAITLNKKIVLIGAGINPDSTKVTSRTSVAGIIVTAGASNSYLTGVYTYSLSFNGKINGFTISRCYVGSIGTQDVNPVTNLMLNGNIMGAVVVTGGYNFNLSNNLFIGVVSLPDSSYIRNNLFLFSSGRTYITVNAGNSILENNIFEDGSLAVGDFFNNNIDGGAANDANDNNNFLPGVAIKTIFPTYDPSVLGSDGIFKVDFNLPANSPYKNAGTDGTDIGIYGGAYPWKPGSVPINPHFQSLTVAPKTDASGNLQIQVIVAAQDH